MYEVDCKWPSSCKYAVWSDMWIIYIHSINSKVRKEEEHGSISNPLWVELSHPSNMINPSHHRGTATPSGSRLLCPPTKRKDVEPFLVTGRKFFFLLCLNWSISLQCFSRDTLEVTMTLNVTCVWVWGSMIGYPAPPLHMAMYPPAEHTSSNWLCPFWQKLNNCFTSGGKSCHGREDSSYVKSCNLCKIVKLMLLG